MSIEKKEISTVLSNRLDSLYEHLESDLFSQNDDPYKKRLIVVPARSAKSYLLQKQAERSAQKIAFGCEFLLLEEVIEKIITLLLPEKNEVYPFFPQALDFQIAIEELLFGALEKPDSAIGSLFLHGSAPSTYDKTKLHQFAKALSLTMKKWSWQGMGGEKERESNYSRLSRLIWNQLVAIKKEWIWPSLEMQKKTYVERVCELQGIEVYLFGFSSCSTLYHEFFVEIRQSVPVNYYILSPCMMFWADILSDKEALRVKLPKLSEREALIHEELLFDRNLLLANSGKIGREFAHLIEESAQHAIEEYRLPQKIASHPAFSEYIRNEAIELEDIPDSLLQFLQADLLLLLGKRKEKIAISSSDTSISIHSAPTYLREIEVLYQELLKKAQTGLGPCDVIVLAPNIECYLPYIERIFGATQSAFSYQIIDESRSLEKRDKTDILRAFFLLCSLPEKRFSVEAIFELFLCRAFLKKSGLEAGDLPAISNFFLTTGFRWGRDGAQRQELFVQEGYATSPAFDEKGSWKTSCDEFIASWQNSGQEAEEIASAIFCIQSLFQDFQFIEEKKQFSLHDAATFFESILEGYFQVDFTNSEERRDYDLLKEAFLRLRKSTKVNGASASFSSVLGYLESAIDEVAQKKDAHLTKEVVFANLGQILPMSAKHVCLIGFSCGEFPRRDVDRARQDVDADKERYLFIEALLAAKLSLTISYQGYSFVDHTRQEPASCVLDLLQAIKEGYTQSSPPITQHPLFDLPIKCTKALRIEKSVLSSYIPTLLMSSEEEVIDVKFLRDIAKSPLKAYFQHTSGLFLSNYREEKLLREAQLEKYDLWNFNVQAFETSKDEFFELVKNHPRMPSSLFQKAILNHLQDVHDAHAGTAKKFGIDGKKPVVVELSSGCKEVEKLSSHHLIFPAISLELENKKVTICGCLTGLYDEGVLLFESSRASGFFRAWPDLLIRAHLASQCDRFQGKRALFVKDQKIKPFQITDPLAELKKFVSYALECKKTPFCLYPDWIQQLISNDKEALYKQCFEKNSYQTGFSEPYLQFFLKQMTDEDFERMWPLWQEASCQLFTDFLGQLEGEK